MDKGSDMISDVLKESVKEKDLIAVRAALQSKILLDHDLISGDFNECLQYCLENGISESELYVPFSSADPISDEVSLENFNTMYSYLGINFAKERVECIKKIVAALWPSEQKAIPQRDSKSASRTEEKLFVDGERVVSVSEREIVPKRRIVAEQKANAVPDSKKAGLNGNERIVSSVEREVHVERQNTRERANHNSGYGSYRTEKNSMSNEVKTLLVVGAVVLVVAATAVIVAK